MGEQNETSEARRRRIIAALVILGMLLWSIDTLELYLRSQYIYGLLPRSTWLVWRSLQFPLGLVIIGLPLALVWQDLRAAWRWLNAQV